MTTPNPIDWAKLREPFHPDEIEWRVGNHSAKGDRCTLLAYLTARAVQDRLDHVLGPERWRDSYERVEVGKEQGFICTLEILLPVGDGLFAWVGKQDAADVTDIEAIKGGVSSALKRAAVKWGIGRYLYDMPKSGFLKIVEGYAPDGSAAIYAPIGTKEERKSGGKPGHVFPPKLPDEFLPVELRHKPKPEGKSKPKETDEEKAARQAEHHKSWEADKGSFFRSLDKLKMKDHDEVVRFCLWRKDHDQGLGLRPSRMDNSQRKQLLILLGSEKGAAKYAEFLKWEEEHGKYGADTIPPEAG